MKIIFMGTPDFSVPTLQTLIDSEHEVVACYTQPDKPKGRGKKMHKTPVKELCERYDIPVYQPKRMRHEEAVQEFQSIEADVAVVIAYGQILPASVLFDKRYGSINIHASLLPKYRGAAPYQWAVINGEQLTGITTMNMDVGIDTGDMLLKKEIPIDAKETAGSLHDKLMYAGGDLLLETLQGVQEGTITPIPQKDEEATSAPLLNKNSGKINWNMSATTIERLIRGMNPWPSAFTFLGQQLLKIWEADVIESGVTHMSPGTIVEVRPKEGIVVQCQENQLLIRTVQLQGKRRMSASDFINGYQVIVGSILE